MKNQLENHIQKQLSTQNKLKTIYYEIFILPMSYSFKH